MLSGFDLSCSAATLKLCKPLQGGLPCSSRRVFLPLILASASLTLSGCALGTFNAASSITAALPAISGKVHGGQQPVAGAAVQLYAASTTASKGTSTALLTTAVMTDANGNFDITSDYTCPTANTLVYLVATGGNPGLPGNVNNANLALMAALGTCGTLTSATYITVNELTTVASVEALAPFMADEAHIGSDPGNTGGLAGAFATAASLVNFSTGQAQPSTSQVTQPTALLNTLADILAACVNSNGGTAGDATACGMLLKYAGNGTNARPVTARGKAAQPDTLVSVSDTITIILEIVVTPAGNVEILFDLVGATAPFQPVLTTAPKDWTVPVTIALPVPNSSVGDYLMAIDTAQHVWIYTHNYVYDPISNTNIFTGTITIYDNQGNLLHTIPAGSGGLYFPGQLAADPFGNMLVVNQDVTVSKFDPNGAPLTPASGISVPYLPPAPLGGSTQNYPLGISYMETDPSGNLWGIGSGTNSNCFIEASNSGTVITPSGNFCSTAGNTVTIAAATDGSGNAWFVGDNSVSKVNSAGAFVLSGVSSNGCFDFNLANQFTAINSTLNLAYDRSYNQLWGASDMGIGAIRSDGTQVFCDSNGANLPLIAPYESVTAGETTVGYQFVDSIATDGGGNLWFMIGGLQEIYIPDPLAPVITVTTTSGLNELDPTGKLITPNNAQTGSYGFQTSGGNVGENLAIDAYGNIWIVSSGTYSLIKIPGLAVPKNYQ